jgi:nucleotide-binding universal stress UspA family protein
MTVLVPYDGSAPARAALWRGRQLTTAVDEPLLVVTVLPGDADYAREKGWIDAESLAFDRDRIAAGLRREVTDHAPTASFRSLRIEDGTDSATVAGHLRAHALDVDATVLVVGCNPDSPENPPLTAGHCRTPTEPLYDVLIVRCLDTGQAECPPDPGEGR